MGYAKKRRDLVLFAAALGGLVLASVSGYALWDDEANTALFAASVWKHGVPLAMVGDNIVAFRHGVELTDSVNLFMPPLPYYIAAPFVGLFGRSAAVARLPFCMIGLMGIVVAFAYMQKAAGRRAAFLFGMGIFGNVSLLLYIKQARYYSLIITLSIILGVSYLNRKKVSSAITLSLSACLLLVTHYLAYVAVLSCVIFDYAVWGHKEQPVEKRRLLSAILIQVCAIAAVVYLMQPFGKSAAPPGDAGFWQTKALLLTWTIRDMNRCEFGLMGLILLAPVAYLLGKADQAIFRMASATWIYLLVVCFLSPQPVGTGYPAVADVRYMIATIPLLIAIAVRAIQLIGPLWGQVIAALLVFMTNGMHAVMSLPRGAIALHPQSTLVLYLQEINRHRNDPYAATSSWLQQNANAGATVASFPRHTLYPLMWASPEQIYAWQFLPEQRGSYASLSPIHFEDEVPPDFLLGFGLGQQEVHEKAELMNEKFGVTYKKVAFILEHFPESYRPEFYWRIFHEPSVGPEGIDGVTVYQKQDSQLRT